MTVCFLILVIAKVLQVKQRMSALFKDRLNKLVCGYGQIVNTPKNVTFMIETLLTIEHAATCDKINQTGHNIHFDISCKTMSDAITYQSYRRALLRHPSEYESALKKCTVKYINKRRLNFLLRLNKQYETIINIEPITDNIPPTRTNNTKNGSWFSTNFAGIDGLNVPFPN